MDAQCFKPDFDHLHYLKMNKYYKIDQYIASKSGDFDDPIEAIHFCQDFVGHGKILTIRNGK